MASLISKQIMVPGQILHFSAEKKCNLFIEHKTIFSMASLKITKMIRSVKITPALHFWEFRKRRPSGNRTKCN